MSDQKKDVAAIIVAAGSGKRFGEVAGLRKQYRELGGVPLVVWSVKAFLSHPKVAECILVVPHEDVTAPPPFLERLPVRLVAGGAERHQSVRLGLEAIQTASRTVLIHDGARPLVSRSLIDRVIAAADQGAAIPGTPVTDTLKEVAPDGRVLATPDRNRLRQVQTPQGFPTELLLRVHRDAHAAGIGGTDDAALFEHFGLPVRVVEGDATNLKVTQPLDLELAEFLAARLAVPAANNGNGRSS